jgi:Lon protease-like protein
MKIPLFPLNTVLFPQGELQLRLFEPRYIDMVSECLRSDSGFGLCLRDESKEITKGVGFFPLGTYVKIIDWDQMNDGLLGIKVIGERRFKVENYDAQKNNLYIGNVTLLDEDDGLLPEAYQNFSHLLKEISKRYKLPLIDVPEQFEKATWISDRLAELLPFDITAKQSLLEMNNSLNRLDYMQALLIKINSGEYSES